MILFLISISRLIAGWAGTIGGIWLICQGYWELPVFALIYNVFLANYIVGIVMIPSTLYLFLIGRLLEEINPKSFKSFLLMIGSSVLTMAAIAGYDMFIFEKGLELTKKFDEIPILLIALSMATFPWQYVATQEQGNEFTQISNIANEFLCILCAILFYFELIIPTTGFLIVFFILLLIQILCYKQIYKEL